MKKIKLIARKPYFLVFSCICIFIFLSSFKLGVFRASTSKKQVSFPVISLVPNLVIADVKVENDHVLLSLRNDSDKAITALSWSSSEVIYKSEMIGSDDTIAVGATKVKSCGLPSPTSHEKGITILAVVYEDGTSDGDAKFVKEIFAERAGEQEQLARILPLFRDTLVTRKNMSLMQKREVVKLKLEQLPVHEEEGWSLAFRTGLHNEKERAMNNLKQLEQVENERGEDIARKALLLIIDRYEKRNLAILNSLKQVR
ncbi:MAG: hypothetical protein V7641_919 [Blastocatellia bacterium]